MSAIAHDIMNAYFPQSATHPGEMLEEKLEEIQMGVKEFALRSDKPEKTIIAILKGESSVTPDMALSFEKVLEIPASLWNNMQSSYNDFQVRERRKVTLADAQEWTASFPYNEMTKLGWVPQTRILQERTEALLSYFKLNSPNAWSEYYLEEELKTLFRISLKHAQEPHALSAWLRHGEVAVQEMDIVNFNEAKLKEALPKLKKLMAQHPSNFFEKMIALCAEAGVILIHTPCLPKTPINGATRWIGNNALIQLSGRTKRNDIFWFTFFHEVGHILLHGTKEIFLDGAEYDELNKQKEKEADDFAVKWTLTKTEEEEIRSNLPMNSAQVAGYAKKFGTHPGVIIGRLQHQGDFPHNAGRNYFEAIDLQS